MHFLLPSLSPYATPRDVAFASAGPRALEATCSQVFARETQLLRADPRNSTYLACGMLFRGAVTISDVQRNLARIKPTLRMVPWNPEVRPGGRGGGGGGGGGAIRQSVHGWPCMAIHGGTQLKRKLHTTLIQMLHSEDCTPRCGLCHQLFCLPHMPVWYV